MKTMKVIRFVTAVLLGLGATFAVCGGEALTVILGTTSLQPNQPGQTVPFYIANEGDSDFLAQGATINFEVDDGVVGVPAAPLITGLDLLSGTVWQSVSLPVQTAPSGLGSEFVSRSILDFGGGFARLEASSYTLLAMVTFDTTGLDSGSWSLRLDEFASSAAKSKYVDYGTGLDVLPTVTNGELIIVPEPPAFGQVSAVVLLAAWWLLRRRRSVADGVEDRRPVAETHPTPVPITSR